MHQLFKFEWFKCRDGYRIEERSSLVRSILEDDDSEQSGSERFIVPKSANWETYQPLDIPAAYRAFAAWKGSDEGLRKLADAYGSMTQAQTLKGEYIDHVRGNVSLLRGLVSRIDRGEWQAIAGGLTSVGKGKPGHPKPGIGRLGVAFEVIDGKPTFRLKPATLLDALQAQALFDAAHGIEHKKCRNPECEHYFPISGRDALRSDAEYHSEACRRRHAYLIRKKERRS